MLARRRAVAAAEARATAALPGAPPLGAALRAPAAWCGRSRAGRLLEPELLWQLRCCWPHSQRHSWSQRRMAAAAPWEGCMEF